MTCVIVNDDDTPCGRLATHMITQRAETWPADFERFGVTHIGGGVPRPLCDEHAEEQRQMHLSCGCYDRAVS